MKCPMCGHDPKARKAKPAAEHKPAAELTTTELYAMYKRTAPIEDTRFFVHALQRGGHHGIANQAIVLLAEAEHGLNRAEVYRRLVRLQESWRCEGRPAADEAGFWRKCRQLGARDRGKDYRQLRDHVVDEIRRTCDRRSTRAWTRDPADWEDQRSDVVTSTIKLVRVARTICPWIDALQPTGNIPEVQ